MGSHHAKPRTAKLPPVRMPHIRELSRPKRHSCTCSTKIVSLSESPCSPHVVYFDAAIGCQEWLRGSHFTSKNLRFDDKQSAEIRISLWLIYALKRGLRNVLETMGCCCSSQRHFRVGSASASWGFENHLAQAQSPDPCAAPQPGRSGSDPQAQLREGRNFLLQSLPAGS